MAAKDYSEFKNALREICLKAPNLDCPYDRVRCCQWVKKLAQMSSTDLELAKIRNEYIQLLRIQIRHKYLHGIFKQAPPNTERIAPLGEVLGNNIARQYNVSLDYPWLPKYGRLRRRYITSG